MAARSRPGRSTPPASIAESASRSAATRCAWVSASPISRRPHSASRPPSRWSAAMAARTRSTTNAEDGVLDRGDDQVAGVRVEVRRDLAVEVVGQPVADVRLDQALVPVGRRGVLVEEVERLAERRHRQERVRAELADPVVQRADPAELEARHAGDLDLVLQRRRQLAVLGEPLERRDLAVGDRARAGRRPRRGRPGRRRRRAGACGSEMRSRRDPTDRLGRRGCALRAAGYVRGRRCPDRRVRRLRTLV